DSSAIINSRGNVIGRENEILATTDLIIAEIKDFTSRMILDVLKNSSNFMIHQAGLLESETKTVMKEAEDSKMVLSNADLSVAALAYHYKQKGENIMLLTDDYRLQNLLGRLSIPFKSILRPGISEIRRYRVKKCRACNHRLEGDEPCPNCGFVN
ncbi:MAG: hypothetical protein ACTSP4_13610, partial [Candidatus Hodarchaeales archaeon]